MANFKVVISDPNSKKAYQKEVDQAQSGLSGKKVGEKVSGSGFGLEGYELEITGGSDREGFPIRPDVEGQGRKKIILTSPPGYHPKHAGRRKRKSVRGNTVSLNISQVNLKVVKSGSRKLAELFGKKAEKPEAKEEKKEAGKEAEKAESKPAEGKPENKPAERKDAGEADVKPAETEQPESAEAEKAEAKMGVKKIE